MVKCTTKRGGMSSIGYQLSKNKLITGFGKKYGSEDVDRWSNFIKYSLGSKRIIIHSRYFRIIEYHRNREYCID